MPKNDYSAGMVSKPFWFIEFKKVMTLLDRDVDYDEIKRISLEEDWEICLKFKLKKQSRVAATPYPAYKRQFLV